MKKLLVAVLALVMILASFAAFAEEKVTFTMGFDPMYPPYSYMGDDGEYTGFDIEVCKACCEILGWDFAEYAVNWETKDLELNAFACDCVWSGFTINGREAEYEWSFPYADNTQVILTTPNSDNATSDALAGKVIGVETGTSAYELLQDEKGLKSLADTFASLEVFDSYVTAASELKAGSVDALVIDVGVAQFYVKSEPDNYAIGETLASEQYGIGFRIGETDKCEAIEGAIIELYNSGKYMELAEKYGLAEFICVGNQITK